MSKSTAKEVNAKELTPDNASEVFVSAAVAFVNSDGGENERQRLLEILQNKEDCRSVLTSCMNKEIAITAFMNAGSKNDLDLLEAFYGIGMNVDAKSRYGSTALTTVCGRGGEEESICWLLDRCANVDIQDSHGYTPLMRATCDRKTKIVKMLLQKNANPDIQNNDGMTALIFACSNDHKQIVQLLLSHNADTDLKNNKGETALEFAGKVEIIGMLRNHVNTSYVLK